MRKPEGQTEPDDETDYERRHVINLFGAAALLIIAIAIVWTVKAMDDYETLQRCVNTGRRDCVSLSVAPAQHMRVPTR